MAVSQAEKEFTEHVVELAQAIGPVYSRRMFGGSGIFLEGLMFGLIANRVLYLKVDDETRPDFEALGLQPFSYRKQGRLMQLAYLEAPEQALESMEVMSLWANKGYEAALRAAMGRRKRQHRAI